MDKVDAILASEEPIVPSSGFAAAVMQRVRQEAVAPPPIPFPWKRAIPGFILAALVLGFAAVQFVRTYRSSGFSLVIPRISFGGHVPLDAHTILWLAVALALALGSWLLTRRLTSSSSGLL
jgi:hypothetical protein